MRSPRFSYLWLFFASALVAGAIFWHQTDWWFYVVESDDYRWPKFKLYWYEQLIVSGVVGVTMGAAVVLITSGFVQFARRLGSLVK